MTAVVVADAVDVALGLAEGYPWGWEGGGWAYRSLRNYLISAAGSIAIRAVLTVGMALALSHRRLRWFALILVLFVVLLLSLSPMTSEVLAWGWAGLVS
ncbi:hypothetical protein KXS07_25535 [Inquilinus limosus]|uniref:hypothetical protein n=1 Tax=Inquilinus limosus TaxID=171674 RepID=UPI003F184FEF